MPALTPADKAFVVAEYYAGSSASQIQRKFKRDRNKSVSLPTVSRWLKRVKSDFVTTCSLQRKVGNHNDTIYKELRDNGIEPYPSGGRPFDVEGGYQPNSHDCMPCELINDHLKENARKAFEKLRKSRRNMKSLQTVVANEARNIDIEFIRARIGDLPKIMATIERNGGGRTKY